MKQLIVLLILSFATVSYGQGPPGIQPGNVNSFTKVGPPPIFTFRQQLGKTMASTWSIQYPDNFPTGDARTALQYAVDIWRFYVSSTQTIRVQAKWVDFNDPKALAKAEAAYLPRNFTGAPQSNTGYPIALAEMLAGQQMNGDSADIIIRVNSAQTNWYFGTDGNTPAGKFDFVSVILHEIAHGLGFLPSFDATTYPNGSWGNLSGRDAGYKTIYDSKCIFGTQHNFPAYNLTNTTSYPSPSSSLYSALTSDNVFTTGMLLTRSPAQPSQSSMLLPHCGRFSAFWRYHQSFMVDSAAICFEEESRDIHLWLAVRVVQRYGPRSVPRQPT